MTTSTTMLSCTTDQLRALRGEAAAAGDLKQVKLCDLALAGTSPDAYRACVEAIQAAEAQVDTQES